MILTQIDPRRLERTGGEALIVLPIVGSAANALDALEEALSLAESSTLEAVGAVLVGKLSDAKKLARLEELLLPGRNGRSASRPRRSRSSRG